MGSIKVYLDLTYPSAGSYPYSDFKVITYSDSSKSSKILENSHSTASGSSLTIVTDDITSYSSDLVECGATFSPTDNEDDIVDLYLYFKTTVDQLIQTNLKI